MKTLREKLSNNFFLSSINGIYRYFFQARRKKFGYIADDVCFRFPCVVKYPENVYIYEHCHLMPGTIIMAPKAKFIMKKCSGAAENLMVVTNYHPSFVGEWLIETGLHNDAAEAKDIIVEEDVWIASNVTLLMGVTVGRGSIVGAGCVVRNNIPPYAMVVGNPAKVVGFKFTPEEIIEHEKALYPEEERLPIDLLEKNYKKYFKDHYKEIKSYLSPICK